MTTEEIICIICPLGCKMNVESAGKDITKIKGHRCKKGTRYAQQEIFSPGRFLTTTIKTVNPDSPLVPVRSNKPIPKDKLDECMREIAKHLAQEPVQISQAVIRDILDLNIDIIASRSTS